MSDTGHADRDGMVTDKAHADMSDLPRHHPTFYSPEASVGSRVSATGGGRVVTRWLPNLSSANTWWRPLMTDLMFTDLRIGGTAR